MSRLRKNLLLAGFLVVVGIVRLPVEAGFQRDLEAAGLGEDEVDLPMREEIGQASFVAVLGGFRSLVASILNLEVYTNWEKREWGKVDSLYEIITRLQPRILSYWDEAGWHMAYNAASDSMNAVLLPEAGRRELYNAYLEKGIEYLEDGVRNIPDSHQLPGALGLIYKNRSVPPNHLKASEWFARAAELPGAPSYYPRFSATELAKVPGREREAYEALRSLYLADERNHQKTLIAELRRLEGKLVVPEEDRLINDGEETPDP